MKVTRKNTVAILRAASVTVLSLGVFKPLPAWAQTANTTGPVLQGTSDGSDNYLNNNPAITISFSGQTALRTFNTTGGITLLQPGTSIVLHDGTDGAPVTYTATNTGYTNVQLASSNFDAPDYWEDDYGNEYTPGTLDPNGTVQDIQVNSAIELQWHEQGSIDGFYDLINDEVGYAQTTAQAIANNSTVGPISNEALRTPSASNPTWINTNKFTTGATSNGFTLNNSAADDLAATYSTNVYTQATGVNILGGQNRIQFSVGEYPTEAFSVGGGTASPFASPGSAGYGLGNTALSSSPVALTSLGTGGLRQTFQSTSIADESTAIDDPQTGGTYAAGPWNTAGASNITSTPIAAVAVTYSANPGTGLLRIDLGDAQWLQTAGRLQNGALFNVVARTVDTGQRAVFALNTGIDPSWAVGSNDDGNSTSTAAANAQHSIGPSLRFDGKTSGTEAEKTIAQSRMALGALSVPEARGASGNAPIRALDVDFNAQTDVNSADDTNTAAFVRANFGTIISSNPSTRYQAVLISHYNSVKAPNPTALYNELVTLGYVNSNNSSINPGNVTNTLLVSQVNQATAWADVQSFNPANLSDPTTSGIKGDTTGDVASFIANIANSVNAKAAANSTVNGVVINSANDPADALLSQGFLLPGLLDWTRLTDGGTITPVTLNSSALSQQQLAFTNYAQYFTTDTSAAANVNTDGSSATYGAGNTGAPAINGSIPITAKDVTFTNGTVTSFTTASNGDLTAAGGNYLFGNFNQNGVRDYSAVQQAVNAALSLYAADSNVAGTAAANSIYSGAPNSTIVKSLTGTPGWVQTGTNTKGDLIVLGDYNGDGSFNGEDLYLLAIGASLADSTSSNTLTATVTNFSDVVRNPNDVLRKNAALNYINNYLNSDSYTAGVNFIRTTGEAVLTGATVPAGATDLHATDPITGLEQFTYDPTGANAFNPGDVDRSGLVDVNSQVLVDEYYGQSYQNLTESLAATAPAPVTGQTEPISLVAVQQVDGEAAIGSADLAVENSEEAQSTAANWYDYNLQKTGPGTITWGQSSGSVTVYSGASFEISSGLFQIGSGTLDPFSDNTALATAGNHVALTLDHGGQLKILGPQRTVTVSSLNINTSGRLDVGNGGIAINYGTPANDPVANIASYLTSGYAGGAWTGTTGIISTTAQGSSASAVLSVGYADGNTDNGTPAGPNQIVVKYALAGDANLDGFVNSADLLAVVQNFNKSGTDWAHGNFTYITSGQSTTSADLLLVVQNFNRTLPFSSESGGPTAVLPLSAGNAVQLPEPSALALVAAGAGGLLARRRRRKA
jgi:hypothetical protein